MSTHAVRWVLENSETKGSARLVMLVIAERFNEKNGYAHPGLDTIADEANLSRRQVIRILHGEPAREKPKPRPAVEGLAGDHVTIEKVRGTSNRYRITGYGGDTQASLGGVTPGRHPGGVTPGREGVTPGRETGDTQASPEPSKEPSEEPGGEMDEQSRAKLRQMVDRTKGGGKSDPLEAAVETVKRVFPGTVEIEEETDTDPPDRDRLPAPPPKPLRRKHQARARR